MHGDEFFFQAIVYLSAALISVPVAKRLGLGSVLGYLVAGILIGPFCIGLVGAEGQDVMHFAEFGVTMMLFLIGLELQPMLLWRLRAPIIGMGGLQVSITAIFIAAAAAVIGLPLKSGLAIGLILALSSTAIVLQSIAEKGLIKTDAGQSSFSVLLFQDIAVIPIIAILPLLAIGSTAGMDQQDYKLWIQNLPAWLHALVVLGIMGAITAVGLFLVRPFFRIIAGTRLRELFTASALLLVIGTAYLMTKVGMSPALGTFMAGVVLANSEYRHELQSDIEPFKGLLLGLFFIAVGAGIDFRLIISSPGTILALVCSLMIIKALVLFILGKFFRMSADQNILFALALAQGSEFGFVLFSFALQHNVLSPDIVNPMVAAVAVSMAFTPLLLLINEKFVQPRFGTKELDSKAADYIDHQSDVIVVGFDSFGSLLGRLLRANGLDITVLELDSDKVELLRKLGLKVYYGDASRYDLLRSAGAENAKILVLAMHDHKKQLQIVNAVKKYFPNLKIFAQTSGRTQAYELYDAGVDHIYRETLDTSLRAGTDVLRALGFRSYQAHRAARTFRLHDEQSVEKLRHISHDHTKYLSAARQHIEDLEELLISELNENRKLRDDGWDASLTSRDMNKAKDK
ncbi:MAG: cation:proton antiporter [Nitrospirae bacterium]|nr:cation:proton antiporter [Nitrospirota bacterium]